VKSNFIFQAHQLGRDAGEEFLVYIAMYNPCKTKGVIKKFGFGPKSWENAQTGFVKEFFDGFGAHCKKLKGK